jgi:HEAT repeat protein
MFAARFPIATLGLAFILAAAAPGAGRAQPPAARPSGNPVAELRDMLNGGGPTDDQARRQKFTDLIGHLDLEQASSALLLPEWRSLQTGQTTLPSSEAEKRRREEDFTRKRDVGVRFIQEAKNDLEEVVKSRDALKAAATADLIGETAAALREIDRVNRALFTSPFGSSTPVTGKETTPEGLPKPVPVPGLTEGLAKLSSYLVQLTEPTSAGRATPDTVLARRAAARALGQIRPTDAKKVIEALAALLDDPSPELRQTAAQSIYDLAQTAADEEQSQLSLSEDVRNRFAEVGQAVGSAIFTKGLARQPLEVRRRSLRALGRITAQLLQEVSIPPSMAESDSEIAKQIEESKRQFYNKMVEMLKDFESNAALLADAAQDRDPEVSQSALAVLSALAAARQKVRRPASAAAPPEKGTGPVPPSLPPPAPELKPQAARPVGAGVALAAFAEKEPPRDVSQKKPQADNAKGIGQTLDVLGQELRNAPDPASRRGALDVLEILGESDGFAKSGAPFPLDAVIDALGDPDKFVRWAAARTLGNMAGQPGADGDSAFGGGDRAARTVQGLSAMLTDQDPAVRVVAATALERIGKAAHPTAADVKPFSLAAACQATPRLIASINHSQTEAARFLRPTRETEPDLVKGDPSVRVGAMHALEAIEGDDPDCGNRPQALHEAVFALGDGNAGVRQAAADMIGRMGRRADKELRQELIDALGKALTDTDSNVRRAVSGALLSLMRKK